jgi:N-acetyl-anhydromuramyl-L-alanine amidase AmpD
VTTHLILHHAGASGATAQAIHEYHLSKGWAGIAYHYYVRKSGEIVRGRPENTRGGHTTDWNYCSIGVCFEGNFEAETMPDVQMTAGRKLVADIVSRYPSIVIGKHSQFGQTVCPGKNFRYDEIISAKTEPTDSAETGTEPDVWAKDACEWATGLGIFVGDGSGDYRWRDAVTRQEFAVLLKRYNDIITK